MSQSKHMLVSSLPVWKHQLAEGATKRIELTMTELRKIVRDAE